MKRREFVMAWVTAAGVASLTATAPAAHAVSETALLSRCADACVACATACETCTMHSEMMTKSGVKGLRKLIRMSEDCGEICALAFRLCRRHGPLHLAICEACIKACTSCGAECRRIGDAGPLADCAKACEACVGLCRELIAARG